MGKKDKLKAVINILTSLVVLSITGFFSVSGYVVINYKMMDSFQLFSSICAMVAIAIAIFVLFVAIKKHLRKLKRSK